jgi:hypothetical protein
MFFFVLYQNLMLHKKYTNIKYYICIIDSASNTSTKINFDDIEMQTSLLNHILSKKIK